MVRAFAALPKVKKWARDWTVDNSEELQRLGQDLHLGERVLAVAVGQPGMGFVVEGIVVTTQRVCVVRDRCRGAWIPLAGVSKAQTLPSVRGRFLSLQTSDKTYKWWELQPPGAGAGIARFVKHGTPPVMNTHRKSTAKFLGGDFRGNLAKASPPLGEGSPVIVHSNGTDYLSVESHARSIAEYPLDATSITIDRADRVGLGIRKGRLAGIGAAALILSPLALAALPWAAANRVKIDYVMAIDDGTDKGIFALSDSAFGAWITARRSVCTSQPDDPSGSEPYDPRPSMRGRSTPTSECLHELERLHFLLKEGGISESEYLTLKQAVLGSLKPTDIPAER